MMTLKAIVRRLRCPPLGLLVFLGYTLLAVMLTQDVWTTPQTRVIGLAAGGDAQEYVWSLAWPHFALTHFHNPFITTWLNAPAGANLMWFTPPLPGVLMTPVTALWGPVVSYNVLTTLAFSVSAWCMWFAIRSITGSRIAALLAGLFYGFSPFIVEHNVGHTVLAIAFVPPLLLLLGYDALVRRRWPAGRTGIAIGVLGVAQLMTFPETLASIVLSGGLGIVWLVVLNVRAIRSIGRARVLHAIKAVAWALVSAAVLAAVPLYAMFFGRQHLGSGLVHDSGVYVSDLLGYVFPTSAMALHTSATDIVANHFTGNTVETNAYLGVPLLFGLGLVVWMMRRSRAIWVVTLAAATTAILSLGPELHIAGLRTGVWLPAHLIAHLPLMGNLLPSRLSLLTDMWVSLLIGMGVAEVLRRRSRAMTVVATGLICLSAATLFPAVPYPTSDASTPPFFTSVAAQRIPEGSVALVVPYTVGPYTVMSEVWQAATGMRFKMPEGYIFTPGPQGPIQGPTPTELGADLAAIDSTGQVPALDPATLTWLRHQLHAWDVQTVVVGPSSYREAMLGFMTQLLDSPGEDMGGVTVWWNVPAESWWSGTAVPR